MLKTSVNNFFISTIKKKKYKHNKYWDVEIVQKYLRNIAIQTFFQYAKTLLGFIYMCNTSWNKMVTNGIKLVKLKYPVLPFSSEQRLVTVIYRNIVVCNSTSAIFCHISICCLLSLGLQHKCLHICNLWKWIYDHQYKFPKCAF